MALIDVFHLNMLPEDRLTCQYPLQGYIVRIKANREVEHLSSRSIEGVIRVSTLKDLYSNSSNRTKRCDGYERRWLEHQEWLHI